jgi:hypothetical protein
VTGQRKEDACTVSTFIYTIRTTEENQVSECERRLGLWEGEGWVAGAGVVWGGKRLVAS